MNGCGILGGIALRTVLLVLLATQITHASKVVKRKYQLVRTSFAFCSNIRTARSVDLTTTPGAVGEDVVDACVTILDGTELFGDDHGFLKRLALVLTNFGNDIDGSGDGSGMGPSGDGSGMGPSGDGSGMGPSGGIWSIDEVILGTATGPFFDTVIGPLGFGGVAPEILDTSVPLVSAIIMRVYITIVTTFNAIPGTVEGQAQWFEDNLGGNKAEFIEKVNQFDADNACVLEKMDVWFLIDDTNSGTMSEFQEQLQLISEFMNNFPVESEMVRVGLSTYTGGIIAALYETTDFATFNSTLMAIPYNGAAQKNLATALSDVTDQFNVSYGARPLSQGVPRAAFVFASGSDEPNVLAPADALRARGVTVFAMAYGLVANVDLLVTDEVANDPNIEHTFFVARFSPGPLANILRDTACTVSVTAPENTNVDVLINPGNAFFATLTFPVGGSITIVFEVSNAAGEGVMYFSLDAARPNPAIHAIQVVLQQGTTTIILNDIMGELELAEIRRSKRDAGADLCLHTTVVAGMTPLEGSFVAQTDPNPFTPPDFVCAENITIMFNQTTLDELNAAVGDVLYVSQNPSDKPQDVAANCQVVVSADTYLMFMLTECNPAVTQDFVGGKYQAIYTVWRQPAMDLSHPIQRYKDYFKTFECVFNDELLLDSISIVPEIMKLEQAPASQDGSFALRTDLCTTSDCSMPLAPGSQVFVPNDVYVKILLTDLAAGIDNFYVIMENCWATKDADPASTPFYQLISNKLVTGGDTTILRNSDALYGLFKFETFVWTNFTEGEQTISVHCDVTICDNDLTDCTMLRRRRRSVQKTGKLISSHQLQLRTQNEENAKCLTMPGYCSDLCNDMEQGIECSCYDGRALSVDSRTCYDTYTIKADGNREYKDQVVSSDSHWMMAVAVLICAATLSVAIYAVWNKPRRHE